jgi:pSer/pThr/pTyr-binding forkhead associated (FHA) protein
MVKVVIYADDESVEKEIDIDRDEFVIGRRRSNDVQILDPTVSGSHARVRINGHSLQLTDLGSTNGTEVSGKRVQMAEVLLGQRFRLGSRQIAIFLDRSSEGGQGGEAAHRETKIMREGKPDVGMSLRLIAFPESATIPSANSGFRTHVLLAQLARKPMLIGSSRHCSFVIESDRIGPEHARLSEREGRFFIQSLAADETVLVNGNPVIEAVLAPGDEVRFGDLVYRVEEGDDAPAVPIIEQDGDCAAPAAASNCREASATSRFVWIAVAVAIVIALVIGFLLT